MKFPLLLVPCALVFNACSSGTPSTSAVNSGANGIRCDVGYDTVDVTNLKGIVINDRGIGAAEKIRHLNELNAMPKAYLDVLRRGISFNMTAGSITEFPEFRHLAGVTPRGWEDTGLTWDSVPGIGGTQGVFLGDSARPNDTMSLALHETTHAVDVKMALRTNPVFLNAYNAESKTPHPDDRNPAYRLDHPEEYLAMAVDEYHCSSDTRSKLKAMYPRAFAFVERDLMRLLGDTSGGDGREVLLSKDLFVSLGGDAAATDVGLAAPAGTASAGLCFGDLKECVAERRLDLRFNAVSPAADRALFKSVSGLGITADRRVTVLGFDAAGALKAALTVRFESL